MGRVGNFDFLYLGGQLVTADSIGILQQVVVTLTDAQIKALPTTGITLVPAPGVGYRVKYLGGSIVVDSAAGAYTNINTTYSDLHIETNGADYIEYGPVNDSTTTPPLADLTNSLGVISQVVFDLVGNVRYNTGYVQGPIAFAKSDQNDKAAVLKMDNNGSGNLTGGNAANTMKVTMYYAIETL